MANKSEHDTGTGAPRSSAGAGGFLSHFSSRFSDIVTSHSGHKTDHYSRKHVPSMSVTTVTGGMSSPSATSPVGSTDHSDRGEPSNLLHSEHRKSNTGSTMSSWSWRRRFSNRPSIGIVAEKFTSATNISNNVQNSGPVVSAVPSIVAGLFQSNSSNTTVPTSMRERVIEPKKVPDFLIPMASSDRRIGGSISNIRTGLTANHSVANLRTRGATLSTGGDVAFSSSFYGGFANSPEFPSENTSSQAERNRRVAQWRHGSFSSSLDNLIYGTLQTNELIKRSSTELINDLVEIIAPESTRKSIAFNNSDNTVIGSSRAITASLSAMPTSNGEFLQLECDEHSMSAYSSNSMTGRTSGQWECHSRCIATVRLQLADQGKYSVLGVFFRRLHNTAASANFYSQLKASVMRWKIRLIIATNSCKVLKKRKFSLNGPMPLEELEVFSGVNLPKPEKLLRRSCSVWLRVDLCHRLIDDDDYEDAEDSGLWQNAKARKTATPKRATTRKHRFPPFHVFISNLLPVKPEWLCDVECPSVKMARCDKQLEMSVTKSGKPLHIRSFAAFPCCCNSTAAFDKTLLTSGRDKRNMVVGLLSTSIYVFPSTNISNGSDEVLNVLFDMKEVHWRKPGFVLAKYLDFWLFAKTTHVDGKEEKSKTGMKTSRLWAKSEMIWRVRSKAKRGAIKSLIIRLSGRTINSSRLIASIELSETSEDYLAAQLFHTIFRHVYADEHYNRPAETLSKSLLRLAGDGDESNAAIRRYLRANSQMQSLTESEFKQEASVPACKMWANLLSNKIHEIQCWSKILNSSI